MIIRTEYIKPEDVINPLRVFDVTRLFDYSNFALYAKLIKERDFVVKAIALPGCGYKGRAFCEKQISSFEELFEQPKGFSFIIFDFDEVNKEAKGPIANNLEMERLTQLQEILNIRGTEVVFFYCDEDTQATTVMEQVAYKLALDLDLIEKI